MKAFFTITGIIVGNFIFQYLEPMPDYMVAVERSYFGVLSIITYVIVLWATRND